MQVITERVRPDPRGRELLDFAHALAAASQPERRRLEPGSADVEAVGVLAGEGLLQVEDGAGGPIVRPLPPAAAQDPRYWMPARIFREVLRRVHQRGLSGAAARPPGPPERPPGAFAVVDGTGRSRTRIPLSDIEWRILSRLLSSSGRPVGTDELAEAVWGPPPDEPSRRLWQDRLKQRLTVLRRKLAPHLIGEPIVNVYGRGYCVSASARISLER